ncbi:MAG: lysylphosphatidylglycerol synthase transmembrane domain-containing protein [Caldilineaceae bacterium]
MDAQLRTKFLWSLLLALVVYMALILYADWRALTETLAEFKWIYLPGALALTLGNYAGRLFKWHWYLQLVGVHISRADSARIFGVGMLMVMTPGNVGEFLKSYMVKNVTGAAMSITAPVVLAERMTDGLAMLILAGLGLFAFHDPTTRLVAVIALLGILTIILLVQVRPLALWVIGIGEKLPVVNRFAHGLHDFYESSYRLFRPRNLVISVGIGVISWVCEGIAYYLVLIGMGVTPNWDALLIAVFIFSISTVVGAVIATPGGLGGTEGSLVALSGQLLDLARTPAGAAALLIRFATLWFGVGIGIVSVLLWPELLAGKQQTVGSVVDTD